MKSQRAEQQRAKDTKAAIIKAARAEFAAFGFEGAGALQVAEAIARSIDILAAACPLVSVVVVVVSSQLRRGRRRWLGGYLRGDAGW